MNACEYIRTCTYVCVRVYMYVYIIIYIYILGERREARDREAETKTATWTGRRSGRGGEEAIELVDRKATERTMPRVFPEPMENRNQQRSLINKNRCPESPSETRPIPRQVRAR